MGYTVTRGNGDAIHCETHEEVIEALKKLNAGRMPRYIHTSPRNIERYNDSLDNVISVIPDAPPPGTTEEESSPPTNRV